MQPGTYVTVHRHALPGRWELLTILQGEIECLIFDEDGSLKQRQRFAPAQGSGVEFAAGTWHTVRCLKENTVILEVKPGPYDPKTAAEMAEWCPKEGEARAGEFADWLETARDGQQVLKPVSKNRREMERLKNSR